MADIQRYTVTESWLNISCKLGEGPHYDENANILYFVDIERHELHSVDMNVGAKSHKILHIFESAVGCLANVDGSPDELIIGGFQDVFFFNVKTKQVRKAVSYWNAAERMSDKSLCMRGNDGAVDPQGRFWVGVMCDPRKRDIGPEGTLMRVDANLTVHRILEEVAVPNGMSWSQDGKTMYFTDTMNAAIEAFDWHGETGTISNRRTFWSSRGIYEGGPDGHAMDADGNLWVAMFFSSKVVQISPQGKLLAEIELPTRCITCPVFVGQDLIVTSAADLEPENNPKSAENGGQVYKIHVGVEGMPKRAFGGA